MKCVNRISYKIIHNGEEIGPMLPHKGLRQGDSLSPYIFILCVEGHKVYLNKLEATDMLHGCHIARNTLIITHMLYIDGQLFIFRANLEEGE